ncbi:MAG: hypothetical protein AB7W16_00010 [Candidatus Obscuribacterales bacterium]
MRKLNGILGSVIGSSLGLLIVRFILVGTAVNIFGVILCGIVFGLLVGGAIAFFDRGIKDYNDYRIRCINTGSLSAAAIFMVVLFFTFKMMRGYRILELEGIAILITAVGGLSGWLYSRYARKSTPVPGWLSRLIGR